MIDICGPRSHVYGGWLRALLTLVVALLTVGAGWLTTTPLQSARTIVALLAAATVALTLGVARPLWLFPLMALSANLIWTLPLAGANPIPADATVACLLLAWFGARSRHHWTPQAWRILVPFLLLIGLSIVSLAYSWNRTFGMVKVVQLIEFLLAFLLTVSMLREPTWMRRTLVAYVASCIVLAGVVIVYIARTGIHGSGANIWFYQKNGIGLFLMMALTIASAILVYGPLTRPQRAIWNGAWTVLLGGTILTGSRGAWIAYMLGCVLLSLPKGKGFVLRLALIMGLAIAVLNAMLPQTLLRTNDLAPSLLVSGRAAMGQSAAANTALVRLVVWRDALGIIAAHPLTGVGAGGYISYDTYQGDSIDFNAGDPHDMILYEWAELGTGGLAIFLWLIGSIIRLGWRAFRRAAEPETRWLAGAAFASLMGYLIMSLTEPFWTRGDGLVFFVLVGIVANLASAPSISSAARGLLAPEPGPMALPSTSPARS